MIIKFGESELTLSQQGVITDLTFRRFSVFPKGQLSYLIRLFQNNMPCKIRNVSQEDNLLVYYFEEIEDTVSLRFVCKEDYIAFEVVNCPESFDFLTVGPIATRLNDVVGDVVGVVQGEGVAVGIQSLSRKLLAGFPEELRQHTIHVADESTSALTVGSRDVSFAAASPMPFGSVLRLFGENRCRDRIKTVWYAENCVPAPALDREDANIRGCRFALFSCPGTDALTVIGRIEENEGLPHPVIDGEWVKTSRKATYSYLIGEFGTENIDRMLSYAKKGGFPVLYHPEPFDTWGHFELRKEQFPEGDLSLKNCVEQAEAQGIKIGLHTLSTFTKTNDSYVMPVPDKGLKGMLPGSLTDDVAEAQTQISVDDLAGLSYAATLNCIRIEDELIQYSEYEVVSDSSFLLKGCKRGAFGTWPAVHKKGCSVCKLADYPYHTLFPDIELQDKFADRIAELFNLTGVKQISFDGLEGCEWTGEGEYAINNFCMRCYDQFDHMVVNDASRLHHFLWQTKSILIIIKIPPKMR